MKERKTHKKLKIAIIITILLIGVFGGGGIIYYFWETTPTNENTGMEFSSSEIYQNALEYLRHANKDLPGAEDIEYTAYSSNIISKLPAMEELSSDSKHVSCDYAGSRKTIPHQLYMVDITMNYAGQPFDINVYEYVSEGYSPLHHHEYIDDDGQKQLSAMKKTGSGLIKNKAEPDSGEESVSHSMEQKYAKLKGNNRNDIEDACKEYLYHEWYSDSNEIIKVTEYEIGDREYGILCSEPEMYDDSNVLVNCKFYYLDDPEQEHTLYLSHIPQVDIKYLSIDDMEYTNLDKDTLAQLEQEFSIDYSANTGDAGGYSMARQVCSQDRVCQQAKADAVQQIKKEYADREFGGITLFAEFSKISTYEADNFIYSYDPSSACHTLVFTLSEYDVSGFFANSYTINAQYKDNGNGSISKIGLIIQ